MEDKTKIANEMASVITYLHTAFPRLIIHKEIHGQQFHLDQDLCAKLSDFILCMALPEGQTQIKSEHVMAIYGYVALEVVTSGVYLEKSDVFCFGSLLLGLPIGKSFIVEGFELHITSYIKNHTMNEIVGLQFLLRRRQEDEEKSTTTNSKQY